MVVTAWFYSAKMALGIRLVYGLERNALHRWFLQFLLSRIVNSNGPYQLVRMCGHLTDILRVLIAKTY